MKSNRFCTQCARAAGLAESEAGLALDVKYTTQNRLVICEGIFHKGAAIMVDPSGTLVEPTKMTFNLEELKVKPGHTLVRA